MYVYAYQNSKKTFLYVGSTQHVLNRFQQHKRSMPWMSEIASITVWGPYENDEGLLCEKVLISKTTPSFNTNMAEGYCNQDAAILHQKGTSFGNYNEMKQYFHTQATEPKRSTFYLLTEDNEALRLLSFYSGEKISTMVQDLLRNAILERATQLGIHNIYDIAREQLLKKQIQLSL